MKKNTSIGKYVIQKRIGGGHFGEVYLAHDRALACNKAIKIISIANPGEIMQKLEEAQILDKCRHKHIVQINEANILTHEGNQLLVLDLEYLPEGSLESEMSARWISVRECCVRISAVLSGLHFAHSSGYLHRDIKPGNVLICGESTKLSDFGLATQTLNLVGSDQGYLAHCPPEFYTNNKTTQKTDIYATGLTLFRLVNNMIDWRALLSGTKDVNKHIENGTLIKKIGYEPYVPDRVKRIINKACNADPAKRYGSALEMKNALDGLRFQIDWHKDSDDLWVGFNDGAEYEISITQSKKEFAVDFKKNGRRDLSRCTSHTSIQEARQQAAEIVGETTL